MVRIKDKPSETEGGRTTYSQPRFPPITFVELITTDRENPPHLKQRRVDFPVKKEAE